MWTLTKNKPKTDTVRGRTASNKRVIRAGRPGPLISAPPRSPMPRNIAICVAIGLVLGVGGFAFVSSDSFAQATQGASRLSENFAVTAGLKINRVTVTGRDRAGRDDILAALGAQQGRSIFDFDCHAARDRLMAMSWIANANVRRVFPGEIQVDIEERKPFAVWQNDGQLMLVDKTGFPIVPVGADDLAHYPHVVGIGANENAAALMDVLKSFPDLESRVRAAVRVGNRRWDLQLSNGIAIELPADDIEVALKEVVRLDRDMNVLSSDLKAIDMRFKDRWILKVPPSATDAKPGSSRAT